MVKAAGVVGAATLLSRILGYVRDAAIAWFFGAGLSTDAFIAAFRIPNLFRRLFGEGSLSNAFVPVFTDYITREGQSEAFKLARSALRLLSAVLVIISLVGVFLSPLIVHIIAPGFAGSASKLQLTVTLTRIMFPYIFFVCLVALCMGILNVLGHFAAPALAPVLLNLAMISAVLFISPHLEQPVLGLAIGVVCGGVMQLGLQVPFLVRYGIKFWQKTAFFHSGLNKIGKMLTPVLIGGAAYQLNILVSTLLASFLKEGSVSYLYFADRLVQFPLGIFAVATATAVLPGLSRQAATKDVKALKATFAYAMNLILFLTLPAMVGLIVLREPIIVLLFQRGEFGSDATMLTAHALLYYAIGLWAFSAVRIVVATFFALQDTRTPAQTAIISIIANILFGIVLMQRLGHGGLAMATTLASIVNLGLLIRALRIKLGRLGGRSIALSTCRTMVCSGIMGIVVWKISVALIPSGTHSFLALLGGLMMSVTAGLLAYGAVSYLIKSPELIGIVAELKNSIKKK